MAYVFQSMELDDEDKQDLCLPCPSIDGPKPSLPEYPWELRIALTARELKKLGLDPATLSVGSYLHGHFMACITSISSDKRSDGEERQRVELQIEKLCIESEDAENTEAAASEPKPSKRRRLYA